MRRLAVLCMLFTLAALSPAPIRENPKPGTEPLPEHSRQQLVEEQRNQQKRHEVGSFQSEEKPEMTGNSAAPDAAATMQAAAAQQQAAETVKKASTNAAPESGGLPMIFWAILLAAIGFGSVYAFRYWVAKTVPLPGNAKKPVSW